MVTFSGVDHVSFSVTDLDRSERFYTEVFDLIRLLDFGTGRIFLHTETGFIFTITTPEGAQGQPFTELATGLDHIGFTAGSRDELVEWESKLDALGVAYTPIRDMEFGYHLNFRDPDNIALEITAHSEASRACLVRRGAPGRGVPGRGRSARERPRGQLVGRRHLLGSGGGQRRWGRVRVFG